MFDIHPLNQRSITVSYAKADGTPGEIEGAPQWTLTDPSIATLTVAADGMSAVVQHSGGVGEVMLEVRADGDLGAGVFPIVVSEVFSMRAPLGATAGSLGVSEETTFLLMP